MPHLTILSGTSRGKIVALAAEVVRIGRDAGLELTLPDTKASRVHIEIQIKDGQYVLRDMKSKNGTLVNGTSVTALTLKEGDQIQIGETRIAFSMQDLPSLPGSSGSKRAPLDSVMAPRFPVGVAPATGSAGMSRGANESFETLELNAPLAILGGKAEGEDNTKPASEGRIETHHGPKPAAADKAVPAERNTRSLRALYLIARGAAEAKTSNELWTALTGGLAAALEADRVTPILLDSKGQWEIAEASELRTFLASPLKGKREYGSVAISADGRFLAAGAFGGAAALWDLPTGNELVYLEGSPLNFVAFENGPQRMGVDQTLLIMQLNGLSQRTICIDRKSGGVDIGPAQKLPILGAHFVQSQDGRVLASAQILKGAVVRRAAQPDHLIELVPREDVRSVGVSPDGRWVATGRWDEPGGAKIWDIEELHGSKGQTFKPAKDLPGAGGHCWTVFSPDGKHLLTTGVDFATGASRLRRWEVGSWDEIPFNEPIEGKSATFSPDGKLVVLETGSGVARLIDAETGTEYARLEDPDHYSTVHYAFTPDGTKLACATGDGCCVRVWNLQAIRRQLAEMDLDWK